MMEKTKIGLNAGKVWRILNEKGELSMFDLCRELSLTFEDVALAIGWLAREDKIFLRKREGKIFNFYHVLCIPFFITKKEPIKNKLLNIFMRLP